MTLPLSRRSRQPGATAATVAAAAAAAAAAGLLAAVIAPALAISPAAASPADPCAHFGATAAGDLVTLRLLDLRPLGVPLAPVADVKLATSRAGLTGATGRTAAQARYVQRGYLDASPEGGALGATAYQLAPPANPGPTVVNPGRLELGVARAGTGDLYASAAYRNNARCDSEAGAASDASAALLDATVLPGQRALLRAPNNLSTSAHAALISHRGGTGAEAATTAGLVDLSLFGSVPVRVITRPKLRAVAGGGRARSSVEYTAPGLAVGLPDGRTVVLDQPAESVDLAVPGSGTTPLAGLPALPGNPLPEVLGKLPGVPALGSLGGLLGGGAGAGGVLGGAGGAGPGGAAGAGAGGGAGTGAGSAAGSAAGGAEGGAATSGRAEVAGDAGSPAAPDVPGLPALPGVPGVGGLLGGTGQLTAPGGGTAVVLRLTAGELSKSINDAGVHAKAISLRLKLLLVRGSSVATLVDLCIGVLEVAATAPGGGYGPGGNPGGGDTGGGNTGGGYGSGSGSGGEQTGGGNPSATPVGHEGGGGPGESGRLPVTGARIGLILAAGLGLLTAGRLLMVLARRRFTGTA